MATTTAVARGSSTRTQTRSARQRLRTARLMEEARRARVRTTVAATSALQVSPTTKVAALAEQERDSACQLTREEEEEEVRLESIVGVGWRFDCPVTLTLS